MGRGGSARRYLPVAIRRMRQPPVLQLQSESKLPATL
jgi:hypothetical protein